MYSKQTKRFVIFVDTATANRANGDSQEITDCRSVTRRELSNETSNTTAVSYLCGGGSTDVFGRKQFCITCPLNASSSHYNPQQRFNYVLQLLKITRGSNPADVLIAFNLTGVLLTETDDANGRTISVGQDNGQDEGDNDDYYIDSEFDEDAVDGRRGDRDNGNAVHRVVFVIDETVEPGMYRGRIYNSDQGAVSAIVKGMINVAFDDFNWDDNIVNDTEDDTGWS